MTPRKRICCAVETCPLARCALTYILLRTVCNASGDTVVESVISLILDLDRCSVGCPPVSRQASRRCPDDVPMVSRCPGVALWLPNLLITAKGGRIGSGVIKAAIKDHHVNGKDQMKQCTSIAHLIKNDGMRKSVSAKGPRRPG